MKKLLFLIGLLAVAFNAQAMIVLDSTSDNVQVVLAGSVTTTQPKCVSSWRDITTTAYTAGKTVVNTNNTTDVNVVPAPAASTQRVVDLINCYNADTVSQTITIKVDVSGTEYILWKGAVAASEFIQYVDGSGWVKTSAGGGGGAEVNDLSSVVTWTNIPDANVPSSAVTQHESALEAVVDLPDLQGAVTDAQVPNNITITLASTATALAANGSNCSAGSAPLGVDASGAAESCFSVLTSESVSFVLAASDETTALTTGTGKLTFRMPHAMTVTGVRASVITAPTGSPIIVDINENGSTIMTTNKLSIDATEKTSTTAATTAGVTDTLLADDSEITIDTDQVGSTGAGVGLKVVITGTRS